MKGFHYLVYRHRKREREWAWERVEAEGEVHVDYKLSNAPQEGLGHMSQLSAHETKPKVTINKPRQPGTPRVFVVVVLIFKGPINIQLSLEDYFLLLLLK